MLQWHHDLFLNQMGRGTVQSISRLYDTLQDIDKDGMVHVDQVVMRVNQANSVLGMKYSPLNSPAPVYHFLLLEGTLLETIQSGNRWQFNILDILLMFACVYKSHLVSGMTQGRNELSLFHCFEIRRVDGFHL